MHVLVVAIDWHIIWQRIFHPGTVFWHALWATIYISVVSQVLGVALGLVAALDADVAVRAVSLDLGDLRPDLPRHAAARPDLLHLLRRSTCRASTSHFWTIPPRPLTGILALSINEGAYMREIIRAGIDSIDRGQMEAAKSLGMRHGLAMRRIILPQAARVIVPPLGNEFNNMMKNTSLLYDHRRLRALRRRGAGLLGDVQERVLRRGGVLVPHADDRLDVHPGVDRAPPREERAGRGADLPRAAGAGVEPGGVGTRDALAGGPDERGSSCTPTTSTSASASSRC